MKRESFARILSVVNRHGSKFSGELTGTGFFAGKILPYSLPAMNNLFNQPACGGKHKINKQFNQLVMRLVRAWIRVTGTTKNRLFGKLAGNEDITQAKKNKNAKTVTS